MNITAMTSSTRLIRLTTIRSRSMNSSRLGKPVSVLEHHHPLTNHQQRDQHDPDPEQHVVDDDRIGGDGLPAANASTTTSGT